MEGKKQKTKKSGGGKKHTKHFEENNLKINKLSRKKGITRKETNFTNRRREVYCSW